ncbi:toll/interleukin-1 receptor domain-containing protein [Clostridium felsineum]|uniref:Uncharacterized protein n=1 Tax=Clostridium felsineum TaxID=36839 RepID=A0A1S8L6Z6_9CLOT|nr:toll/interleukin-1 receptor domain-containing protein [Clostridium felsineum]URZ04710.1 hypothetical protein CLROS_000190 [Clostridium felsineum]URZ09683.1 hypothetical protein CROST_003760 [Clostridium felsineum]
MTIFISHKREDSTIAGYICNELTKLNVKAYLDVLEGNLLLEGKQLTDHIKERINSCTDILVVMSDRTKDSWWVPFEIGMAAQNDFPIVSYLVNKVELPDYLSYWPTLRKSSDLWKYVRAKEKTFNESTIFNKSFDNAQYYSKTEEFYKKLKSIL